MQESIGSVLFTAMSNDTLLSMGKFADAGYITIIHENKVNIYDGKQVRINVTLEAITHRWQDLATGLYQIPLKEKVESMNRDTVLLDEKRSQQIRSEMTNQIEAFNNVYKLTSTAKVIGYLHAAAGFPAKATWLKAKWAGNYDTWPMVTVRNETSTFQNQMKHKMGI